MSVRLVPPRDPRKVPSFTLWTMRKDCRTRQARTRLLPIGDGLLELGGAAAPTLGLAPSPNSQQEMRSGLATTGSHSALKQKLSDQAAESPYLTMREAAEYLRYTGPHAAEACRQFLRRHGIRLLRRGGRVLLVKRSVLDAFLETGKVPR